MYVIVGSRSDKTDWGSPAAVTREGDGVFPEYGRSS